MRRRAHVLTYAAPALFIGLALVTTSTPASAAGGAVEQGQSGQGSAPAVGSTAPISDGTIGKAGAALRDVAKVQSSYAGRLQSAGSNDEKRSLSEQANAEAVQAIEGHGLSIEEYSKVVQTARYDPQVKQRLLSAAHGNQ